MCVKVKNSVISLI